MDLKDITQATNDNERRKCSNILGSLHIEILEAKALPNKDVTPMDKTDAFVKIKSVQLDSTLMFPTPGEWHSSTVDNSLDPKWDAKQKHSICHSWIYVLPYKVRVEVWDKDKLNKDDFVGYFEFSINNDKEQKVDQWYNLLDEKGQPLKDSKFHLTYTTQFLKNNTLKEVDAAHPRKTFISLLKMHRKKFKSTEDLEDKKVGFRRNAVVGVEIVGAISDMLLLHLIKDQPFDVPEKEYWKKRHLLWRFYVPSFPTDPNDELQKANEKIRRGERVNNLLVFLLDKFATRGFRCLTDFTMIKKYEPIYSTDKSILPRHALITKYPNVENNIPNIDINDNKHLPLDALRELNTFAYVHKTIELDKSQLSWAIVIREANLKNVDSEFDRENLFANFLLRALKVFLAYDFQIIDEPNGSTFVLFKESPEGRSSREGKSAKTRSQHSKKSSEDMKKRPKSNTKSPSPSPASSPAPSGKSTPITSPNPERRKIEFAENNLATGDRINDELYLHSTLSPQRLFVKLSTKFSQAELKLEDNKIVYPKRQLLVLWEDTEKVTPPPNSISDMKMLRLIPTTFIGHYKMLFQGDIGVSVVEGIAKQLDSKAEQIIGEQPEIAKALAWSVEIPQMQFSIFGKPKLREYRLQRAFLHSVTAVARSGWSLMVLENPAEFLYLPAKKVDDIDYLILDVHTGDKDCIIEVQGLFNETFFNFVETQFKWAKSEKVCTDDSGFSIWQYTIPSHNFAFSRIDYIKKLSISLHYLIMLMDNLITKGFKLVSPYWQGVITESKKDEFPDALGALGYSFAGLLLQKTSRVSTGFYLSVSFVYEDDDMVWLELQGKWKDAWLNQIRAINGFRKMDCIGNEGNTAGWRVFIDVDPYPHPRLAISNKTPINKHYRWFHEISQYLTVISTILSSGGAQFLWRWNNSYLLFYVPSSYSSIPSPQKKK